MNYALWENKIFVINKKKWYNLLLKGWFRVSGRSSRQEYIFRFCIMWFCLFIAEISESIMQSTRENELQFIASIILFFCIVVLFILSVVQVFFVTHRRLHDINATGWWQLITLIPMGQLLMIALIFKKGTAGPNKYGSPPGY